MEEHIVIIVDIVCLIFLSIIFLGIYNLPDRRKSGKALFGVLAISLLSLLVEAINTAVAGSGVAEGFLWVLGTLSYSLGVIELLFVIGFYYGSVKGKCNINRGLFIAPAVLTVIAGAYLVYCCLSEQVFSMENGHELVNEGMPIKVTLTMTVVLVYLSIILIAISKRIDEQKIRVYAFAQLIPVIALVCSMFCKVNLMYSAVVVAIMVTYVYLQLQREKNSEYMLEIQNERLRAFANIYHTMHIINLRKDTVIECKTIDIIPKIKDRQEGATQFMRTIVSDAIAPEFVEKALKFTDLTTLPDRFMDTNTLSEEFIAASGRWFRGRFIVIDKDENGRATDVIFATIIVQDEKKKEEGLIRISKLDALTQVNNRRAFEEAIKEFDANKNLEVTVVACDINGLKKVNDTLGHAAGDELIQGATQCMINAFAGYGDIYRTGGDEFVVLTTVDNDFLLLLLERLKYAMATWKGEKVKEMSISFDYVRAADYPDKSMNDLINLADEKMYEVKKMYYNQNGNDRRSH